MSNISNIKIGSTSPDAIMFSKPYTYEKANAFDYYKYANDAGGYWVHGLWIAPVSPWGVYSWPWDLGVTNGALKDLNEGFNKWGYVQDGINKNLTYKMTKNFAENVKGDYKVAITVWFNTPNYTDEAGNKYLDLGEHPIIITFKDNRFDNYTWVKSTGAVAEWSEDKRTVTIYRIPASSHIVYQSNNSDKTIATVRTDLYNVYADVEGLSYNYSTIKDEDPSSVECWDMYVGNTQVYHKDKTYENNLKKYGFVTENNVVIEGIEDYPVLRRVIGDSNQVSEGATSKASAIIDLPVITHDYSGKYPCNIKEYTVFRNTNPRSELWNTVREWFNNNQINSYILSKELFKNSALNGEITLNIINSLDSRYFYMSDTFSNCKIEKININCTNGAIIGSFNNAFRSAYSLREVHCLGEAGRAWDLAGVFEFCDNLTYIDPKLIDYGNRQSTSSHSIESTNAPYAFEYCPNLIEIPQYGSNRFSNANTLVFNTFANQCFNGCHKLTKIGPILDMVQLQPQKDTAKLMFSCDSLEDVRIKRLNHGNWYFDGTGSGVNYHGYLPSLNQESITYLFDNLVDLTSRDENLADTPTLSNSFVGWNVNSIVNSCNDFSFQSRYGPGNLVNTVGSVKGAVNMSITVSGMVEGDRIEFEDLSTVSTINDKSITANGVYTITKEETNSPWGLRLYNDIDSSISSFVKVQINNCYSTINPRVTSAELHCPLKWMNENADKSLNSQGNVIDATYYIVSDYIPIDNSTEIIWNNGDANGKSILIEYDENKEFIDYWTPSSASRTIALTGGVNTKFIKIGFKYTIKDSISIKDTTNNIFIFNGNEFKIEQYNSKITDDMIRAANAKGWSIYIGGELTEAPPLNLSEQD